MTAEELRAIIRDLPPIEIEGSDTWSQHRLSLRRHILEQDPESFLEWSTIQATMYVGNAPYIRAEYEALQPDWERVAEAVRWTGHGSSVFNSGSGYASDTNLIHQAYHLSRWERVTGQRVENLSRIIEFGGGYGAMCLLCRRLGFGGGYWIEDLPELSALQEYYLSNTVGAEKVHFGLPYAYECDLFIASHSLSEIIPEDRERVLASLRADSFLFVYHCDFDGVDNLAWFDEFTGGKPEYRWVTLETGHFENQRYLIGVRK